MNSGYDLFVRDAASLELSRLLIDVNRELILRFVAAETPFAMNVMANWNRHVPLRCVIAYIIFELD